MWIFGLVNPKGSPFWFSGVAIAWLQTNYKIGEGEGYFLIWEHREVLTGTKTGTITRTRTEAQTVGDDLVSYRWHIVFTDLDKLGPYRISIIEAIIEILFSEFEFLRPKTEFLQPNIKFLKQNIEFWKPKIFYCDSNYDYLTRLNMMWLIEWKGRDFSPHVFSCLRFFNLWGR